MVDEQQLNGGEIVALGAKDWDLILPFLEENERLFGISIENDLLMVDGKKADPLGVYRKVQPQRTPEFDADGLEEWLDAT